MILVITLHVQVEYDIQCVHWLTEHKKLAGIPLSLFFGKNKHISEKYIRLCFAKSEQTLKMGGDIIRDILKWNVEPLVLNSSIKGIFVHIMNYLQWRFAKSSYVIKLFTDCFGSSDVLTPRNISCKIFGNAISWLSRGNRAAINILYVKIY